MELPLHGVRYTAESPFCSVWYTVELPFCTVSDKAEFYRIYWCDSGWYMIWYTTKSPFPGVWYTAKSPFRRVSYTAKLTFSWVSRQTFGKSQNHRKVPLFGTGEAIWCKKTNNQRISWHCPFKGPVIYQLLKNLGYGKPKKLPNIQILKYSPVVGTLHMVNRKCYGRILSHRYTVSTNLFGHGTYS